jgi:hypothetical protein
MNTRTKYLPKWVQKYVEGHPDLSRGYMTKDFNNKVSLQFEDGSFIFFKSAFIVFNEKEQEIAVFTEHCGYHCFSTAGLTYQMMAYKPIHTL